jgi:hypothetical protein
MIAETKRDYYTVLTIDIAKIADKAAVKRA